MARPGGHRDSAHLVRLVEQEAVTTLHFVPSMLPFFLAEEGVTAACSSVRRVLVSGEALPWDVEQKCLEVLPVPLHNLYGPTEAAVEVTAWACQRAAERRAVPIGRPIHNTRISLLDKRLELAPAGTAAELVIGGTQVARGYLGRPDLTAELFVPDPHGSAPGARVYRTGDLCRHRHDGAIEFLGRLDDQVKIRGFRIEPREIELTLAAHPLVREVAVVVRGESAAERSLLACVVQRGDGPAAAAAAALRDFLSARLPAYMVPALAFGPELDGSHRPSSLPLLPSGKLDRRALARWFPTAAEERPPRVPGTPAEEILAGFFAEVLGIDRVGMDDGFFDLGGHSLAAMRLAARVRAAFGVELAPHRVFFELPSVAGLANEIARLVANAPAVGGVSEAPALLPVPRTEPLPLSFAQQRLWFLHQLAPESPVYNVPAAVHLRGRLQPRVLAAALGEVARRHESLRTRLVGGGVEGPVQVVDLPAAVPLPVVDLAGLPVAARPQEARRLARDEARRAFDLGRGPLLRAAVVALGAAEQLLLLTLHHAVCDGWSLRLLAHELGVTYGAFSRRAAPRLPPLPIQYGDFAVWQRRWFAGERLAAELAHWRRCLAGAPSLLELSLDRPRPVTASGRGATRPLHLPAALLPRLETLARRQGATLFMTLLAAFQAVLARTAGVEDLCVGAPVAGRREVLVEPLIGCFVNMLVLRADLSGDPRFEVLLARTRGAALAAYAHQDLPFEKLVEELQPRRELSHSPLFQVAFSVEAEPPRLLLGDLTATPWHDDPVGEKFGSEPVAATDRHGHRRHLRFPHGPVRRCVDRAPGLPLRQPARGGRGGPRPAPVGAAPARRGRAASGELRVERHLGRRRRIERGGGRRRRALRGTGGAEAARRRRGLRRRGRDLRGARPAVQPAGTPAAAHGCRSRVARRSADGAVRRPGRGSPRSPQVRRRLSTARPDLPGRAAGLDGRRRGAGAGVDREAAGSISPRRRTSGDAPP